MSEAHLHLRTIFHPLSLVPFLLGSFSYFSIESRVGWCERGTLRLDVSSGNSIVDFEFEYKIGKDMTTWQVVAD